MIQFNLLPDVKLEFIRARRMKHTVILICGIFAAIAVTVFVGLFLVVNVLQKQHLKNLSNDIKKDVGTLQAIPDLNKVLTIQNQLNSLSALHDQKPVTSRVFAFLGQLTPAQATISQTNIDFGANTMTITGNADTLTTVNKFVDTLKFTNYKTDASPEEKKAFSDVVLTSFGKNEKNSNYQLDVKFDTNIFSNSGNVSLVVPKIISTRSQTEKPSDLFQKTPASTNPVKP